MDKYEIGIIYPKDNNIVISKNKDDLDKLFNYIPSDEIDDYSFKDIQEVPAKPIKVELLN